MAEAVGAVRVDFSTSTTAFRAELAKGAAAVRTFGSEVKSSAKAADAAGKSSAASGSLFGRMGNDVKGAAASIGAFSKTAELMGAKASPAVKGLGSALSALLSGGFTPLGLAIGAASALTAAWVSRQEEAAKAAEVYAKSLERAKSAQQGLRDAQDEYNAAHGGTPLDEKRLERLITEQQLKYGDTARMGRYAPHGKDLLDVQEEQLAKINKLRADGLEQQADWLQREYDGNKEREKAAKFELDALRALEGQLKLLKDQKEERKAISEWDARAGQRRFEDAVGPYAPAAPSAPRGAVLSDAIDLQLYADAGARAGDATPRGPERAMWDATSEWNASVDRMVAEAMRHTGFRNDSPGQPGTPFDPKVAEQAEAAHQELLRSTEDFVRAREDLNRTSFERELAEEESRYARSVQDAEKNHTTLEDLEAEHQARLAKIKAGAQTVGGRQQLANERLGITLNDPESSFSDGFRAQFDVVNANLMTTAKMGAEVAKDLSSSFSGAFADFALGTKTASQAFREFAASVLVDIARMQVEQIALGVVSQVFGTGGMFGFAKGGDFTVRGAGGTDSQFVGFMATPGEEVSVRTPGQQGRRTASAAQANVVVHVHNNAPGVGVRTESSRGPNGTEIRAYVESIVSGDLERGGPISRTLDRTRGGNRRGRTG